MYIIVSRIDRKKLNMIDFSVNLLRECMLEATFGLERESIRVDERGYISKTKHPFNNIKGIDRDFSESQLEFITGVYNSIEGAIDNLTQITRIAQEGLLELDEREYLWPFSNPPYIRREEDIKIAQFSGDELERTKYREYLSDKYGRKKIIYSGIHFNFSFSEGFIEAAYAAYNENNGCSILEYKNMLYLNVTKAMSKLSWLIVFLTGSSPILDGSFFDENDIGKTINLEMSSMRNSIYGYWNNFMPIIDYENVETYINSINQYINDKKLYSVAELYLPVRIKPKGKNTLENLRENGINHVEFRMLDVNPLYKSGVCKEDLYFIHLLILYLLQVNDYRYTAKEQEEAVKLHKMAARRHFGSMRLVVEDSAQTTYKQYALEILSDMESFFDWAGITTAKKYINYQRNKIYNHGNRYSEIIDDMCRDDYIKLGLKLAKKYSFKVV